MRRWGRWAGPLAVSPAPMVTSLPPVAGAGAARWRSCQGWVGSPRPAGATIDVAGGAGGAGFEGSTPGSPGGAGFISIVPEPASLVLMATGLLGLLGYTWLRSKRAAA